VPTDNRAALPQVEACCFGGDPQQGNPVTLHVDAGSETWVEIGQSSSGSFPAPTVLVKTSLKPD
jgi:hypothetical protein